MQSVWRVLNKKISKETAARWYWAIILLAAFCMYVESFISTLASIVSCCIAVYYLFKLYKLKALEESEENERNNTKG